MNNRTLDEQLQNARDAITKIDAGYALDILPCERDDLVAQFRRLDAKERAQADAGHLGAEHGKKGGRPKKKVENNP